MFHHFRQRISVGASHERILIQAKGMVRGREKRKKERRNERFGCSKRIASHYLMSHEQVK